MVGDHADQEAAAAQELEDRVDSAAGAAALPRDVEHGELAGELLDHVVPQVQPQERLHRLHRIGPGLAQHGAAGGLDRLHQRQEAGQWQQGGHQGQADPPVEAARLHQTDQLGQAERDQEEDGVVMAADGQGQAEPEARDGPAAVSAGGGGMSSGAFLAQADKARAALDRSSIAEILRMGGFSLCSAHPVSEILRRTARLMLGASYRQVNTQA